MDPSSAVPSRPRTGINRTNKYDRMDQMDNDRSADLYTEADYWDGRRRRTRGSAVREFFEFFRIISRLLLVFFPSPLPPRTAV